MGKMISELGVSPSSVVATTLFEIEAGGASGYTTAETIKSYVLSDYVVVDMASDDYTMTDAEANALSKIIVNGVAGKTLTWPSSCDATAPSNQKLGLDSSEPGIILASETGGNTSTTTLTHPNVDLVFIPGLAVSILDTNQVGIREIEGTSYTVVAGDCGSVLRFTSASPITLTINSGIAFKGMNFIVIQAGAGQVTFAGTSTRRNINSHTKTQAQYASVGFICDTAGEFNFAGATA